MAIALEKVVDSLILEEKGALKIKPTQEKTKENDPKEIKLSSTLQETVENSDETITEKENEEDLLKIEYGLPEELLAGALYNGSNSLNYTLSSSYQELKPFYAAKDDEEEKRPQGWILDKQEAEMMTPEEVKEAVADAQFAAASGSYGDVDSRTRERLKFSALFDPSAFWLIEKLGRVTSDVDYSRTV